MEVKAPKCAHVYERRLGNNWYKKKTGENERRSDKAVSKRKGIPILRTFHKCEQNVEEQMHLFDETFITRSHRKKPPLPITTKIEAINVIIFSVS